MSDAEQKPNIESDELRKRIVDGLHKHYVRINDYDGPVVRAMVKTCEEIIKANQSTPPAPKSQAVQGDDWLYDVLSKLESDIYNNINNGRNSLRARARTQTAIQAQVDAARQDICAACNGTGAEICDNPDHNFIASPLGSVYQGDIGRIGCPGCGHDEQHRIPNSKCFDCKGSGKVQIFTQAQVDEAVREARKEERRLLQRELDRLQQFQESVINREALRTGPVVVCAGCAKQLTTQPKPSKEDSHDKAE